MTSKSLHLEFKFTDRGGRDVFEIFNAEDNKRLTTPLGSIRVSRMARDSLTSSASITWIVPQHPTDLDRPEQLELDL